MAGVIRRYGIHWVDLDPTKGREIRKIRPCVVVSPEAMHVSGMVVVCPLTTSLHPKWAHRLQIVCAKKRAEIMPDQIRAVAIERIGNSIDILSAADAEALRNLIARLYAMPEMESRG